MNDKQLIETKLSEMITDALNLERDAKKEVAYYKGKEELADAKWKALNELRGFIENIEQKETK